MSVPVHVCLHGGCNVMVPFNQSYCDAHKPKHREKSAYDQYNHRKEIGGKYFKFYKSKEWQHLSYSYRLRHPVCEHCLRDGIIVKADVVDHIVELRKDWSKRLDESNLQSLCNSCHWQKTHGNGLDNPHPGD